MKTKQITVDSGTYTIKEPTVGVLFPIMDMMEKDPKGFQIAMVKGSVFKEDGTPLGDGLMDLGLSDYMALMTEVIAIAGLGEAPKS
jgi:hypothetical protein